MVGLPSNLKRRSAKFLLSERPQISDFPADIDFHLFEVEKVYLTTRTGSSDDTANDDGVYSFIRKRTNIDKQGKKSGSVYQLTTVTRSAAGNTIEEKRIITAREYSAAYMTRDVKRHIVHQQRISFLHKLQSFTIHVSSVVSAQLSSVLNTHSDNPFSYIYFSPLVLCQTTTTIRQLLQRCTNCQSITSIYCMLKWKHRRTEETLLWSFLPF